MSARSVEEEPEAGGPSLIVIDAHGAGDGGLAAVEAAAMATLDLELDVALVGDESDLTTALRDVPHDAERLQVVHAPDAVVASLGVQDALALAPRSSMRVGLELTQRTPGAAFVTAGHPGVLMHLAKRTLDRLPGVPRAGMAAVVPTLRHRGPQNDPFALFLDIGATVRCDGETLAGFARMGAAYAAAISRHASPTVALLSNRSTAEASPTPIRVADELLRTHGDGLTYLGVITADLVLTGDADVIVSDGYAGQVFVRSLEGIATLAEQLLSHAHDRFSWRIGVSMLGKGIDRLRELTNWEHYGGAPLLGVDRTVIVTQSGARFVALSNAVRLAAKVERLGVLEGIEVALRAGQADDDAP